MLLLEVRRCFFPIFFDGDGRFRTTVIISCHLDDIHSWQLAAKESVKPFESWDSWGGRDTPFWPDRCMSNGGNSLGETY